MAKLLRDSSTAFLTDDGQVAGASLADLRAAGLLGDSAPTAFDNGLVSGASTLSEVSDMSTMGARADPGASLAFFICAFLFGSLRLKVSGAVRAKEDRLRQEIVVQQARVSALDNPDGNFALQSEFALDQLRRKEEAARTLTVFPGFSVRVMVPNTQDPELWEIEKKTKPGLDGVDASAVPSTAPRAPAVKPKEEEEAGTMSTGQTVVIGAVFVTQIWLLWLFSFDPMAPPTGIPDGF